MATLLELADLFNDADLLKKVSAALVIHADTFVTNHATATPAQKAWAAKVFRDPHTEAHRTLKGMLGENNAASVAQIQGATDAAIQNNVADVALVLIDADAGV